MSENIPAQQALDWRLVNRVVPATRLGTETAGMAMRLASGPTQGYHQMRQLLRTSFERDYAPQLDAERDAFLAFTRTGDFREGVAPFLERRKPQFTGQ